MSKTVAKKLQIKPGNAVLVIGGGRAQHELLEPLPPDALLTTTPTEDVVVLFAIDRPELDARLERATALRGARAIWIAYPKGNRTDINRDSIWRRVREVGWTLNANVALDDTWSAVRMKPQA